LSLRFQNLFNIGHDLTKKSLPESLSDAMTSLLPD
jgi:hypothetical protein